MKRFLGTLILITVISSLSFSQDISGIWEGKLNAGIPLQLDFHISRNGDSWQADVDCLQQQVKGLRASQVAVSSDSIQIELKQLGGSFAGKLTSDSTISGIWKQGISLPLSLKKVKEVTSLVRPQTPQPPFPYTSEDVLYYNKDRSIRYGATITMPAGKGPFPAILLITGSGQQNRDEEIMGHKPFAVIADYLSRNGYLVMRVDDRGTGQTTGDMLHATSRDFANDAEISLDYLKKYKGADARKIGLIGHSEGGMIAEMIAAERNDVAFIVLLAGPGEKISDLMTEQNIALFTSAGFSKAYANSYGDLYKGLITAMADVKTDEAAKTTADRIVSEWMQKTSPQIVAATTHIKDDQTKERYVNEFVRQTTSPWFKYFISYDPAPYIRKIKGRVLALNGDKDIQVPSKSNLAGIEASLKQSQSKGFEVKEIPGVNHLFQHCTLCNIQEYGQLEETFAPEVLKLITEWLGGF